MGPLKNGKYYFSGPKKMAEILSAQYHSVFSKPNKNLKGFKIPTNDNKTILSDIQITKEVLIEAMKEIDSASTAGPEDLPAIFYNYFARQLATPILQIWFTFLDSGLMPETNQMTIVAPISKGVGTRLYRQTIAP